MSAWTPRKVMEDHATRLTLRRVMKSWPALCTRGFSDDRGAEYKSARDSMLWATLEFRAAIKYLVSGAPGLNKPIENSYVLKHLAERWAFEIPDLNCSYIPNGVMIAAAIAFGLDVKREPKSGRSNLSINAVINLKGVW